MMASAIHNVYTSAALLPPAVFWKGQGKLAWVGGVIKLHISDGATWVAQA